MNILHNQETPISLSCPRKHAHANEGLRVFIQQCKQNNTTNILDIGAGKEPYHTNDLRQQGFNVYTNDFFETSDFVGDYITLPPFDTQFDAIWCSHVLEHQLNVNRFLVRIHSDLKEGGILGITVPPAKDEIVGGHVSLWNAGLLLYNLVLAGFDCKYAAVATYGYNISVVVKKRTIKLPSLVFDSQDIASLSKFFPLEVNIRKDKFKGNINKINWLQERQ